MRTRQNVPESVALLTPRGERSKVQQMSPIYKAFGKLVVQGSFTGVLEERKQMLFATEPLPPDVHPEV